MEHYAVSRRIGSAATPNYESCTDNLDQSLYVMSAEISNITNKVLISLWGSPW